MSVKYPELRRQIVRAFKIMERKGLNYGYSGNVSARVGEGVFIVTPSGKRKAALRPEELLVVDWEGNLIEGDGKPSVELPLHLAVYRNRKDVSAVIHAHPIYATVLSILRIDLEPVVEELALYVGGEVKVADYAPSGTEQLAENAVKTLADRNAVILANHGVLACGKNMDEALNVLECVERTAHSYVLARILGEPTKVPREVVEWEVKIYKMMRL
ncbi:MAG: class II aldolase/adducin family protein [Thermofilaceae archaeon]|nr:class II aldolase/adducin family protein [Thermofilaceae archaeon]MCX8180432.1 class II aldolase/adducin family protein [Thermofilaceae archaeon]MDW8003371.1 class II aldolase/adducin family protein [Thermofilaceae archaeon]